MIHLAIKLAKRLRRNQTRAEEILWKYLRNKKFYGYKFLRQHPLIFENHSKSKFFIPDFYCSKKKVVVEIDGKIHEKQKEYDEMRTKIIQTKNISVIRFTNEEVIYHIETVLKKLKDFLTNKKTPPPKGQGFLKDNVVLLRN